MPIARYDKLFGGKPGSAEKARASMHRSYGRKKGEEVFRATVTRRQHKAKLRKKASP